MMFALQDRNMMTHVCSNYNIATTRKEVTLPS